MRFDYDDISITTVGHFNFNYFIQSINHIFQVFLMWEVAPHAENNDSNQMNVNQKILSL